MTFNIESKAEKKAICHITGSFTHLFLFSTTWKLLKRQIEENVYCETNVTFTNLNERFPIDG